MYILVDYNNVHDVDRRHGLKFVVDRILAEIPPAFLAKHRRLTIRLYDGWYDARQHTQHANTILASINNVFPYIWHPSSTVPLHKILINVELAKGLYAEPGKWLIHTFRPRSGQSNVACRDAPAAGCKAATCALAGMHRFFQTQQCPDNQCQVTPADFLVRNEQKLVDTLLATDLLTLHTRGDQEVAVVSSDDDFWPPIRFVVLNGMTVLHVHTSNNNNPHRSYTDGLPPQYIRLSL